MRLHLLGTNHRRAPVAIRERLAFPSAVLLEALRAAHDGRAESALAGGEIAILSTCNRTEIYFVPPSPGALPEVPADAEIDEALRRFLSGRRDVDLSDIAPCLYQRSGPEAVRHLCRVAAGLDSMILGEMEILGQVGIARDHAREAGTLGHLLAAVFRSALRAGRRSRHETGICRQPVGISSEAVALIRREAGALPERRILIVGTGRMAARTAEILHAEGATDLAVIGRTWTHTEALAGRIGALALPWETLEDAIADADVVLSSTSAPGAVLTAASVGRALQRRQRRPPLLVVDTAVPRDVEPEVRHLAGIRLFDLDDLQERVRDNLALRSRETPAVESIISEELQAFDAWWHGAAIRPLLAALREQAERIRREEFERLLRRNPDLTETARRQVEYLSHSLVNKLLHQPSARLRDEPDPARRGTFADAARHLFGVSEQSEQEEARPEASAER